MALSLAFTPSSGMVQRSDRASNIEAVPLAGGVMLGAFFMATDYTTTPYTPVGQIIFGIGCGVITVLIRVWGGYPEGCSYSILLMNIVTPLIDRITAPKRYGASRKRKEAQV